jgi:hypothetical protein
VQTRDWSRQRCGWQWFAQRRELEVANDADRGDPGEGGLRGVEVTGHGIAFGLLQAFEHEAVLIARIFFAPEADPAGQAGSKGGIGELVIEQGEVDQFAESFHDAVGSSEERESSFFEVGAIRRVQCGNRLPARLVSEWADGAEAGGEGGAVEDEPSFGLGVGGPVWE